MASLVAASALFEALDLFQGTRLDAPRSSSMGLQLAGGISAKQQGQLFMKIALQPINHKLFFRHNPTAASSRSIHIAERKQKTGAA